MNKIEKQIRNEIKENLKDYPFISKFWKISVTEQKNEKLEALEDVKFGHYGTNEFCSYPFYKGLSKIINFSEIQE